MAGCGNLTDKDRIRIATLDGKSITRGDLRKLIRDMDDDKRPVIRNRADLLLVLNKYIDETILDGAAFELRTARAIEVPRARAMSVYFARNPSDRVTYEVQGADQLKKEDFDVSDGQLAAIKADIEFKIDDVEQELLRDAALAHLIQGALKEGTLTITEEEFQQEYDLYKERLYFYERLGFVGIRFMMAVGDAAQQAAVCRGRLDAGESFDDVLNLYGSISKVMIIESTIENNPGLERFRAFWDKAAGAQVGDIVGPVFMPDYEVLEPLPDGTVKKSAEPAAYVVLKVLQRTEPKSKTWQESQNDLAPMILRRKMMRNLREQHGAEIYEDKLPDPGRYESELKGPFVDAGN